MRLIRLWNKKKSRLASLSFWALFAFSLLLLVWANSALAVNPLIAYGDYPVSDLKYSIYSDGAWGELKLKGGFKPYGMFALNKDNRDGTHTMRIYGGPINYFDGGEWKPIKTTIAKLGEVYGVETGIYKAYFYEDHVEVVQDSGKIEIYFLGTSEGMQEKTTLEISGNKATYRSSFDVEYVYTESGLKQDVILKERPNFDEEYFMTKTKAVFEEPVVCYVDGKRMPSSFTTDKPVTFKNISGKILHKLPIPIAYELNDFEDQIKIEYEVKIVGNGNEVFISLRTPNTWLAKDERMYPVVIDPTTNLSPDADSEMRKSNPDTNYGSEQWVYVSTSPTSPRRVIVRYDLSQIPAGNVVTKALLYFNVGTVAGAPPLPTVYAHRVTNHETEWTESGVTWNRYDGTNAWETVGGGGDFNSNPTGDGVYINYSNRWYSWDVTSDCDALAKRSWVMKTPEKGGGYCYFRSKEYLSDPSLRPYLEVTYSSHKIMRWRDNHAAAISLVFDDGYLSQYDNILPLLNQRNLKATFFLITNWVPYQGITWEQWREVAEQGHEIGSHSVTHPFLTQVTDQELNQELSLSRDTINLNIPSQSCVSFAYPYGDLNGHVMALASQYYIAARGISTPEGGYLNHYYTEGWWSAMDFYNIASFVVDNSVPYADYGELHSYLYWAGQLNAWFVPLIHGVPDDKINFYSQFFDDLLARDFWIAPFGTVVRYMREKLASTLTVISENESEIRLNLSHSLDPLIYYNEPLTLRSSIPPSWGSVQVQQGTAVTMVEPVVEGNETVVYYEATPNGGDIVLARVNPVPTLTSLSPSSVTAGRSAFTLTVNGTNFVSSSVVRWNGLNRPTTFVSATRLTAAISAADIAIAGTVTVNVWNPEPGGGISNGATFTIKNAVPTITSLSPSSATASGPAFTLTINGTNFINYSVVRWNGLNRPTTFVSATRLTAAISAADITIAGTVTVTVWNPEPGGGISNGATFTIKNPVPTITSLSPASATASGPAFTLTINGTNFVSGSVVRWKGSSRSTTFVSNTQLKAEIRAADITNAGTASVTVFNPSPGGGTSNAMTFKVVKI